MTTGQLIECLVGKVASLEGQEIDGTPFSNFDIDDIKERLKSFGYNENGNEYLYNGMTGKKLKTQIFIGPTYYQRLKHMVLDKIHCLTMDHEVLTFDGWKTYNKLSKNDLIATLKDGKLVYEKPIELLYYPNFEGKLYNIKNQQIDLSVTDNHRMWVSVYDKLFDVWTDYQLIEACYIHNKKVKYIDEYNNEIIVNRNEGYFTNYKGPVFCLQVPSEVFYVRRNGKAVWTGNSRARGPRTTLTRRIACLCNV